MAKKKVAPRRSQRAKQESAPKGKRAVNVSVEHAEHVENPNLPVIWFDRATLVVRVNPDIGMLRLYSAVMSAPGDLKAIECARLQTNVQHLRNIADMLCHSLDYYPTKPDR